MLSVEVLHPAAWCFVPLRATEMVRDPGRERWDGDGGLDWQAISSAVVDVVQFAQRNLLDPMTEVVTVEIEDLPERERFVVEEWLRYDQPSFDPVAPQVTNGRHRTWFSRASGAVEVPVINTAAGDAVFAANDRDGAYLTPDADSLAHWARERAWWDSQGAADWATRNRTHLALWDGALDWWRQRIRPSTMPLSTGISSSGAPDEFPHTQSSSGNA